MPVDLEVAGDLDSLSDQHRTCVYRVVQEALTNCIRHAHASRVRIRVDARPTMLDLSVTDNGVGLDPAARREGLGLRGIEERVAGIGRHGHDRERDGRRFDAESPAAAANHWGVSLRVLLADDHAIVRRGLRSLLETEPGLNVVAEAADGIEALRLADEHDPDVVILDVGMPKLNGIDVAARLQKAQTTAARHHPQHAR